MGLTDIVNRALFAGALATASVGTGGIAENVAYGQDEVRIKDYYKTGRSADKTLPGSRIQKFKRGNTFFEEGNVVSGDQWENYYFNDPAYSTNLQITFRNLDGLPVKSPHSDEVYLFEFNRFHGFMVSNRGNVGSICFFDEGYMVVTLKREKVDLVVPLPIETAKYIINL